MQKKSILYLDGMYCAECKNIISMALQNTYGIIRAEVSYSKAYTNITYDDEMINVKTMIGMIEKSGYMATENRKEVLKRQIYSIFCILALVFLFTIIFQNGITLTTKKERSYGFVFLIKILF